MKTYDELLAERDALAAHLHNLHEALKAFSNVKAPSGFARDTREYDKARSKCWQNLWAVVNTLPSQCLTEIKAEAIEEAAHNLRFAPVDGGDRWAIRHSELLGYAEKVRQGGK